MTRFVAWVLHHRKTVIAVWCIFFIISTVFSVRLKNVVQGSSDIIPNSPSDRVTKSIQAKFGDGAAYTFPIVIVSRSIKANEPRFVDAVTRVSNTLCQSGKAVRVTHTWNTGFPELIGKDGHSALLLVTPKVRTYSETEMLVRTTRENIANIALGPDFSVYVTGTPAMYNDMNQDSSLDLIRAERWGIPLVLIVLFLVFGSPMAAGLPVVLALISMTVALAGLYALSFTMPVGIFALNAISMIGMGVGVDYSLFILSRFLSALGSGMTVEQACIDASVKAGRSVMLSGMAVALGFSALLLTHARFLHAIAYGGIIIVITAVAASVSLLPVILFTLGSRILWPFKNKSGFPSMKGVSGIWEGCIYTIMKRPVLFAAIGIVALIVLIMPVFQMRPWDIGCSNLDVTMESRKGFEHLEKNFEKGWMGPVILFIESKNGISVWSKKSREAILSLAERLSHDERVSLVQGYPRVLTSLGLLQEKITTTSDLPPELVKRVSSTVSSDGSSAVIMLVTKDPPESREVMKWVDSLRHAPWDEMRQAGLSVSVDGVSAMVSDFDQEMFGSLWRIIPVVLIITFVALMIYFRSLIIPFKALVLNLLSVMASYGFLVLVFQDGIGARFLGIDPPGGLSSFIVLMLFTILFGLSMDYEIFLMNSIKEEYEHTNDNSKAVVLGLKRSGGIITCAALIMVCLFASFGFTRLTATREFGLGLAFAVLVDASLIRVVLVPVFMKLIGKANWWFPGVRVQRL
jgi:putative drug exporter of the RND superfamily